MATTTTTDAILAGSPVDLEAGQGERAPVNAQIERVAGLGDAIGGQGETAPLLPHVHPEADLPAEALATTSYCHKIGIGILIFCATITFIPGIIWLGVYLYPSPLKKLENLVLTG